jgi:SAM-dependent methyltransferase
MDVRRLNRCRVCGFKDLTKILDLGSTPLANSFVEDPHEPEKRFPLQLLFCSSCALVQLAHVVDPKLLFKNYAYRSSISATIPAHFRELAESVRSNFVTSSKELVVEIGSNDGVLLRAFRDQGVRALGVDPAENLARIANSFGLETIPAFFDSALAEDISGSRGKARVVIANNVFAHVDDLHEFMRGVTTLLEDGGLLILEFPYLGDLNQSVEYDTVYHEHLSYFSIHPVNRLFREFSMKLKEIERLEVHGGSVRVTAQKSEGRGDQVFLANEKREHLDRLETFENLSSRVRYQRDSLLLTLGKLKERGRRVVGYGAPAKGNTLLNYCGIGRDTLDYVVDETPEKQGKFTPGMHLPVVETQKFRKDQPEYSLMLAWNYEKEILLKERDYHGQFVIPIPYPRVLSKNPS